MWSVRFVAIVLGLVLAWAAPAQAQWREASTKHFVIYADASERAIRDFADRLERFDGALRRIRRMESPAHLRSNRVTVYVVRTAADVQRLCRRCGEVAGYYIPRAGGSIIYSARDMGGGQQATDIILFHEYAHHFMFENFAAAYPKWFGEGFAELYSTATMNRDGSIQLGGAAQHRAYGLLGATPLPIETLLDPTGKRLTSLQMDQFYGQSWLLTHLMTFDTARSGQLDRYLRAINDGTANLTAAREAFGDLRQLERDMRAYLRRPRMTGLKIPAGAVSAGPIEVRQLTAGKAGMMPLRMRSDRGVDDAEAKALVPEARRRAAAHAADPGVQTMLAEIEYDAGNHREAEIAADRALAADPKRRDALLYKGRARLQLADAREDAKPADYAEARSWFVRANRLDPDAAEPLYLFYTSFLVAGETPTRSAKNGLIRALELSPQDPGLRMTLASMLLTDARKADARTVLLPLAHDPHAGPDNEAARLIAQIDKGDTGGARRALDRQAGEADAVPAPAGAEAPAPAGSQ